MTPALLLEGGESTYNTRNDVVQESVTLTTASQQFWEKRQVRVKTAIESIQAETLLTDQALSWNKFRRSGFMFISALLGSFYSRLEKALRAHWNNNKALARDGVRLYREGLSIEFLIPISVKPYRIAHVTKESVEYGVHTEPFLDLPIEPYLGAIFIAVRWQADYSFVVWPSWEYSTVRTFYVDHPSLGRWDADPILQEVFTAVAKTFATNLRAVKEAFLPLYEAQAREIALEKHACELQAIKTASNAWDALHIQESQKVEILHALELFENGGPAAPSGLLLTGPPGVGKSMLGKTMADTVGCSFQRLTPTSLKQDHLGGSGKRVHEIWDQARQMQPSILFLDECEGVLGRRGAAETDALSAEIVQAFLAEWDGLSKTDRVLVIAATNRRELLDDAILSRFGWEMKITLPSEADRMRILEQELKNVGVEVTLPIEVGALTQGLSGRDLQEAARSARRTAHPELPSTEQIGEAIRKLRKGRNPQVSSQSMWENLILEPKLLARLKLISGLLRDSEKWSAEGISIPRSLLLQGPSGTGKTEIARTLANESGLAFFSATTADIKANYLGQSGNRVKQLFERARMHAPCILFLDELDIVAPDRNMGEDDALTREIVGQLLQEIDGVQSHPEHVFLLGATNRPEAVDSAVLSRFGERLQVPLPHHAARVQLLAIFLRGKKLDFPADNGARLLADITEGKAFSGRDLSSWVASAEQNALLRAFENGGPKEYVITLDDFSTAN